LRAIAGYEIENVDDTTNATADHRYRATTVLVITLGSGVDGFTLDPDIGMFLHTHQDIRIPSAGPIYSFNEANFNDFDEPVRRYLLALKEGSSSVGVRYARGDARSILTFAPSVPGFISCESFHLILRFLTFDFYSVHTHTLTSSDRARGTSGLWSPTCTTC